MKHVTTSLDIAAAGAGVLWAGLWLGPVHALAASAVALLAVSWALR